MEHPERRRIPLVWLLAPFVVSTIAGYVGDILGPSLINDHPLLQILLNPRNRWLLLATTQLDALAYFGVGFLRLVATDPIAFVLGWQYGDAAVGWIEKQMGDSKGIVRRIEAWFGKAAPVVIFFAPSWNWCVLAGASRMRPRLFVALNVAGTISRLVLFRVAGDAFRDELIDLLEVVQRYQWWLVGISLVMVVGLLWRAGGIQTPDEMAEEIEAEEEALHDE